jgi:hypothetical protein
MNIEEGRKQDCRCSGKEVGSDKEKKSERDRITDWVTLEECRPPRISDVSEVPVVSFLRMKGIGELGPTSLATEAHRGEPLTFSYTARFFAAYFSC